MNLKSRGQKSNTCDVSGLKYVSIRLTQNCGCHHSQLSFVLILGLTRLNAVRGASEACDQAVDCYCAGANERSNEEMRQTRKSYVCDIYSPVPHRKRELTNSLIVNSR